MAILIDSSCSWTHGNPVVDNEGIYATQATEGASISNIALEMNTGVRLGDECESKGEGSAELHIGSRVE